MVNHLSVRKFVEFILASGDIDTTFRSQKRAVEGTFAHQTVQKRYQKKFGDEYETEVHLLFQKEAPYYTLELEGRADGIFRFKDRVVVDEIKSIKGSLTLVEEGRLTHWAQARVYGTIIMIQEDLAEIGVQLTYYSMEEKKSKIFEETWSRDDLMAYFEDLLINYDQWATLQGKWLLKRNQAINSLDFPFSAYRTGQREMAVAVYQTIQQKNNLFLQAPTGTGKTLSALFPAIKSLPNSNIEKIFYLTAKTPHKQIALTTLNLFSDFPLKRIELTAKEKICLNDVCQCEPEICPYAKGHFDRVKNCLWTMLEEESHYTRDVLQSYAKEYQVCPLELGFDLALFCDVIIGDYNYVYDPKVYLRRFFDTDHTPYLFLIDESHNLVDRLRSMYSVQINKQDILALRRLVKPHHPKLAKALNRVNRVFLDLKNEEDPPYKPLKSPPDAMDRALRRLIEDLDPILAERNSPLQETLLDFYFQALDYLRIAEQHVDEGYLIYLYQQKKQCTLHLYCMDPAMKMRALNQRAKSSIFFSATLSPFPYFKELLGGTEKDKTVSISSPFDTKNCFIGLQYGINLRYRYRDAAIPDLVALIGESIKKRPGNYMVFFPSYAYMHQVYDAFFNAYPKQRTILQESGWGEPEREVFLDAFEKAPEESLLGFCVLGGVFSEGIDLPENRLIGAILVGIGLPQISFQRDQIKNYFDKKHGDGFLYAYVIPGMNKVMQAGGRVIRTESDEGMIILVGQRFSQPPAIDLVPKHWRHGQFYGETKPLLTDLDSFWSSNKTPSK
jgi:Rad3-related DNA helicase